MRLKSGKGNFPPHFCVCLLVTGKVIPRVCRPSKRNAFRGEALQGINSTARSDLLPCIFSPTQHQMCVANEKNNYTAVCIQLFVLLLKNASLTHDRTSSFATGRWKSNNLILKPSDNYARTYLWIKLKIWHCQFSLKQWGQIFVPVWGQINFFSHSQIKLTEKSICAIRECRAGDKNVNYVVVNRLELINERVSCARQPNKQSAEFQIRHTLARFWCANARTYHMCVRAPPLANFAIFVCASRVC